METNQKISEDVKDLFIRYSDEINKACERAVRDALLKHKRAENSVAVGRNGKVVILQPDEIFVEEDGL